METLPHTDNEIFLDCAVYRCVRSNLSSVFKQHVMLNRKHGYIPTCTDIISYDTFSANLGAEKVTSASSNNYTRSYAPVIIGGGG